MKVSLCGVRGSAPAPGPLFTRVGGNTSCVALTHDEAAGPTLILDAGTGLRAVSDLLDGAPFRGTIVIGHLHWDHMMGLPFFPAGDQTGARVHVLVPEQGTDAEALLTQIMSPPFFPIEPSMLRGDWTFATYDAGTFEVEGFTVTAREIPHKGGRTMGLRVSDGRTTIAYLSDHAPHNVGPGDDGLGELHPAAIELAQGADVLIHDAQYTADELPERADWGHAAAGYALSLAHRCGVATVVLFHHDPSRTDDEVDALVAALTVPEGLDVRTATEGDTLPL